MDLEDPIAQRAQADLLLPLEAGASDVFMWEHALRIARTSEVLADLVSRPDERVDRLALRAAALYHDAGWIIDHRHGRVGRAAIGAKSTSRGQYRAAAELMTRRLSDVLERTTLLVAADAIRRMSLRETRSREAQILSDAETLDQISVVSIWTTVRRQTSEGKGIDHALQCWNRQVEYRYWEALIGDSLWFDASRAIARRRLNTLAAFMEEVSRVTKAADIVDS